MWIWSDILWDPSTGPASCIVLDNISYSNNIVCTYKYRNLQLKMQSRAPSASKSLALQMTLVFFSLLVFLRFGLIFRG